jgi:hypothetical protein
MSKSYSNAELRVLAIKLGKSLRTLRYWQSQGADLESEEFVRRFAERKAIKGKQTAKARISRHAKRHASSVAGQGTPGERARGGFEQPSNGETPVGRRGATGTLTRLESQEAEAYSRLQVALERGDPIAIDAAQTFWLRVAETLRRLDAGLELGRRSLEEQVPSKLACDVALAISDWLRVAFAQFLSSECRMLMAFKDVGEFKAYAFSRFVSILHMTVRNSLKTQSPIPDWAALKVRESWNVQ